MKRKYIIFFLSICTLTGCWDHRELSDITVVTGMAVDKSDDEKYMLSVEGINAQELNVKTASGFAPSIIFTLEGETIAELARKMNIGVSKHLVYSHMKTLIIGEEVAREGMIEFLDFLERNREIRDDFNITIARNVKAKDILTVTYQFQKSSALKIHTQLESFVQNWGGDPHVRLSDVIKAWTSPGSQPIMAALTIKGDPKKGPSTDNMKKVTPDALVTVDSLAIFKEEKLIGFLPLEDTRNILWITNKIKKTAISVPCKKDKFLAIRIYNTKTKIKGKMKNGRPSFYVKVRAEAYLDSSQCLEDLTQINTYSNFEELTEKEIHKGLSATIKKLQQEYKSDILGMGEILYRQDYESFKKIEKEWDKSFQDAIIDVDVKVQLRRSGIRTKSLLSNQK